MKNISEFDGVVLAGDHPGKEKIISVISNAVSLANSLNTQEGLLRDLPLDLAFLSSIQTVTTLLHSASAKCTLATPPQEILTKVNSNGDLVLRCYHSPYHEWDLSGNKK